MLRPFFNDYDGLKARPGWLDGKGVRILRPKAKVRRREHANRLAHIGPRFAVHAIRTHSKQPYSECRITANFLPVFLLNCDAPFRNDASLPSANGTANDWPIFSSGQGYFERWCVNSASTPSASSNDLILLRAFVEHSIIS
jgi:hypothetical protein